MKSLKGQQACLVQFLSAIGVLQGQGLSSGLQTASQKLS